MKTINEGKAPEHKKPWWVDVEIDCRRCGWVGALEEGDEKRVDVSIVQARCLNCPGIIEMVCPTCGASLHHKVDLQQKVVKR